MSRRKLGAIEPNPVGGPSIGAIALGGLIGFILGRAVARSSATVTPEDSPSKHPNAVDAEYRVIEEKPALPSPKDP